MAKQTINIGTSANKGDGDPLRTAFDKINDNFDELYDRAVNTDAQTLTLVGNTLTISGGNSVSLSQYSTFSGSYNDLTNKPTIPSLGNIVFDANGITNPTGEIIDIQAPFAQLQSTDGTYIWVEDGYGAGIEVTYVGGSQIWKFDSAGALTFPGGMTIETEYGGGARLVIDGKGNFVDIRDSGTILVGYNSTGNVAIGNPAGGTFTEIVSEKVIFLNQSVPESSIGVAGDSPGRVAFDATYIYYCTGTYNGVSNIWKRVAWSGDTW